MAQVAGDLVSDGARPEYLSPEELSEVTLTAEMRELAAERMPEAVRAFVDCDGGDKVLSANERAWARWALRPRVLVDVTKCDTSTKVLGREISLPVLISPFTCSGLCHPEAEVAVARGAAQAGTLMTLSARAQSSPEEIHAAGVPYWFHMDFKIARTPEFARELIDRAVAAGAEAVVLTVDLPLFPPLWPPQMMRAHLDALDYVSYSAEWTHSMSRGDKRDFEKMRQFSRSEVTWSDVERLAGEIDLPIVLKGIQTGEDAKLAAESGVGAVIVSNHGGHASLETLGTAEILPEVVEGAAGGCEVLVDGGVRSGSDVVRAVALGASAVLVGRSALWGVAVGGAPGVARALEILHSELRVEMGLIGARSIDEISRSTIAERGVPVSG